MKNVIVVYNTGLEFMGEFGIRELLYTTFSPSEHLDKLFLPLLKSIPLCGISLASHLEVIM